ncbi:MAG: hypothetical protein ACREO3_06025, partial [Arenimonas sp.]
PDQRKSARLWAGLGPRCSCALALAAAGAAVPAHAQLWVPDKGSGAVGVSYQYAVDHTHLDGNGDDFSPGNMASHSLQLRVDYGLTPRLGVHVTVPFVSKRYVGTAPHNPDPFEPHALATPGHAGPTHDGAHEEDISRLDDGEWHGGWQDPGVGLRFRWLAPRPGKPWAVTPFATYQWPSHDYTYFAHAAIGTRQRRLTVGAMAGRQFGPRFPKLFAQGLVSHTFNEEVLDIRTNYTSLNLDLGYHFTPRFSARALLMMRKTHGGLDIPFDFPSRTSELFLHHDQIQRVDYVNWGLGANWSIGEHYALSANWYTTLWGENGHKVHNAVGLGITRSFD